MISISRTWSVLPSVFPFLFFYFLIFFLHIPYPACRHITSFFFSPYPFPGLFYTDLRRCFFYHNLVFSYRIFYRIFWHPSGRSYFACRIYYVYQNRLSLCSFTCIFCFSSSLILVISLALVILYFFITSWLFLFWIFIPFYFAKYRRLSFHHFNFLFNINSPLWFFIFVRFSFLFLFNSKFRLTVFAQAYNIVLTSFISSSISLQNSWIAKFAKLIYFSCDFFIFTFRLGFHVHS